MQNQLPVDQAHTKPLDHIRSFAGRQGRVSPAQKIASDSLLPVHGVTYSASPQPIREFFANPTAPLVLEIGSGMGEATALIAAHLVDINFLACEVYPAGVGALLKRIDQANLNNLKIIAHDAYEVVRDMVAEDYLEGAHVFFPDPWHKARHHKRRLIQEPFVNLLAKKIRPGGYLHLASDWVPYAEQMLDVLSAEPLLKNRFRAYADKPTYRTLSKFENRGLKLGHEVRDLVFERI
jgi:tRNA (guanine-N7-)-methyltransferase